jgi:uncharacterized protein (TIGR00255 family)
MIRSMTAFGRAERTVEGCLYTVEMRCVNRRYCEITVRMPQPWLPLEDRIKKLVAAKVSRGRVDVVVKVKNGSQAIADIEVNLPLAQAYWRALFELKEALETEEKVGLQTLLGLEGIITAREPAVDLEKTWTALASLIAEALEGVDSMRIAEGQALYHDFQKRLRSVEEGLAGVKALAPSVLSEYHSRDPNRLAQEAAFLADRSDITEEIVRAESHLKQFRSMIESEGPAGRALDFLLQELNREVNTMGSKAGDAQLSHLVVILKSELEKIREQVQNIE